MLAGRRLEKLEETQKLGPHGKSLPVSSDMTDRMVAGVLQPDGRKIPEPRMDAKAVGDAVAYMAGLPLDANVLFMTVMASKMPFVGRG